MMTDFNFILAQLSREELAKALRGGFERESAAPGLLLVFGAALLGGMIWLGWRNRTIHPSADRTPLRIFNDLARQFHLSLIDRWLLIRIAQVQGLPNPITLLISPRTMRHHAEAYSQSFSSRRRRHLLRKVASLRRVVFAA